MKKMYSFINYNIYNLYIGTSYIAVMYTSSYFNRYIRLKNQTHNNETCLLNLREENPHVVGLFANCHNTLSTVIFIYFF